MPSLTLERRVQFDIKCGGLTLGQASAIQEHIEAMILICPSLFYEKRDGLYEPDENIESFTRGRTVNSITKLFE